MSDNESSKLLINEEPMQVLPSLCAVIGLNEGLVLQQLHYWLIRSHHEHDERVWIYNTFAEWQIQFPFRSENTLQRIMKTLVDGRKEKRDPKTNRIIQRAVPPLVIVHRFQRNNWDKTNWYSIDYDAMTELEKDATAIKQAGKTRKREIETNRRQRGWSEREPERKPERDPKLL